MWCRLSPLRTCRRTRPGQLCANKRRRDLFNDFVGLPNQRRWQGEPESLRCFQVYSQFKAGRLLHREFTWLGTFEDFSNISGRSTVHIRETRAIGYKTAIADIGYSFPNRGQSILGALSINRLRLKLKNGDAIPATPFTFCRTASVKVSTSLSTSATSPTNISSPNPRALDFACFQTNGRAHGRVMQQHNFGDGGAPWFRL